VTAHDDRARDEQPAPTAREIPADELAEAEQWARHLADHGIVGHWTTRLMAEYDERGRLYERWHGRYLELEAQSAATRADLERERDAARADRDSAAGSVAELHGENVALRGEVERLREELRQADEFGRGEFRVTQHAYDQAVRRIDELRPMAAHGVRNPPEVIEEMTAELERLRDATVIVECSDPEHEELAEAQQRVVSLVAMVEELRARDEAAKAVVQTWGRIDHELPSFEDLSDLAVALDALARAHEEKDGGQNR
jgi:hypothetical protein